MHSTSGGVRVGPNAIGWTRYAFAGYGTSYHIIYISGGRKSTFVTTKRAVLALKYYYWRKVWLS